MGLTRFERKIVLAMVAVAAVPLLAALVLGRAALAEAYEVGVNPRVRDQLDQALELYRSHLTYLRDDADRVTDAVADHHLLNRAVADGDAVAVGLALEEILERWADPVSIGVQLADGREVARVREAPPVAEKRVRRLERERETGTGGARVTVTFATAVEPFEQYQRAGEIREVFARLQASARYVSGFYLLVYIGFLVSVIVFALAVGIVLSRRVTRRVALLAEATQRVGMGDLSVEVPSDRRDEVGELSEAFNGMVRDLRESRSRIDYLQRIGGWQEFARRLAHEIKNPLTPIQLAVQEVARGYQGPDEQLRRRLQDACDIVEEEVGTLRRLVSEFSAFAKLPQAELTPADLGDFVQDLERSPVGLLEGDLAEAGARVELEIPEQPLPVEIDAMMLKRCVDNLVRNAAQAVRDAGAGAPARVVVAARREGARAVLEVRDDGPGVPAQDRQRVFDPYFTTRTDGTGLGLAIVKKVVLEHGGQITCDAAPEGGACFRVTLPLVLGGPRPPTAKRGPG